MPQFVLDVFDKMTKPQLKILLITFSAVFCTGGTGYVALSDKIELLEKHSIEERRQLEYKLHKAETRGAEHRAMLEAQFSILKEIQRDVREIRRVRGLSNDIR